MTEKQPDPVILSACRTPSGRFQGSLAGFTAPQLGAIVVAEAREQVGKTYGFLKILGHFLDWLLLGAYIFRRLTQNGDYPICSWLVAHAFDKAGKTFGVHPGAATPDDIWDFVVDNPDKYKRIRPLTRLWQAT